MNSNVNIKDFVKMKEENNSKKLILFVIIYKISLDILYPIGISPYFAYQGFTMNYSFKNWLIFTIVFLLMLPWIRLENSRTRPSSYIVLAINYLYFIPGCTYYAFAGISGTYFIYYCLFWFLLTITYHFIAKIKVSSISQNGNELFFNFLIGIIAIFAIIVTGVYNGFQIKWDLKDIYEIRGSISEVELPVIISYLINPSAVIVPIGILRYLQQKKYILVTLLIVIQLAIFAFGAHKFVFFILIITLLVYNFYDSKLKKWIPMALTALNVFAIFETYITDYISVIANYIQRRVLFMPNMLSYEYFNFFSSNELDYLRQSFLRHFGFTSPYSIPIPKLIGYVLYGTNTNANTGLVGDAFSNFGWLGIIIYPLLFSIFFYIFDICANNLSDKIVITAAIVIALKFISGTFFSILLSGGGILICFALMLYPRDNISYKK